MKAQTLLFLFPAVLLALSGCAPKAVLTIGNAADGQATFASTMSPTAETMARRFTGADSNLFDRKEIEASLAKAGLSVESLSFPTQSSINLAMKLPKIDGLLERAVAVSAADKSASIAISRESVHAALALMPEGMNDYLDLLMAPVFTGEKLPKEEYVDVIRSAYGKTLGDELDKSDFLLTVRCPSAVKSASIDKPAVASRTGNDAVFRIPLAALLSMETPLTARLAW